jgi:hypothetical protein
MSVELIIPQSRRSSELADEKPADIRTQINNN